MQQLLWIETLLKLSGGIVLLAMPRLAIRLLGLPSGDSSFWPRLLGGVLIGLAGALYLEGATTGSKGLGMGGAVLINLAAAGAVAGHVALNRATGTARGRLVLWLLVALLFLLSLIEIAHV